MTRRPGERSWASIEVKEIRAPRPAQVNGVLQLAQVIERSIIAATRLSVAMELIVETGRASAAIAGREECEQIVVGEEPQAVTPRAQMNEAIPEAQGAEGL